MTKNEIIAHKNILGELEKIIKRLKKNQIAKSDFSIIINGDEYTSEREIIDAYGCDIITAAQKETAIKKYREWESGNVDDVFNLEIKYLEQFKFSLHQDILESEEYSK